MSLMKEVWNATKICTKFGWCASKFIVKNTPTVLGVAWEVKKEISSVIEEEIHAYKKEKKELEMEEKIKMLTHKGIKR
jgi:hypothetical protein